MSLDTNQLLLFSYPNQYKGYRQKLVYRVFDWVFPKLRQYETFWWTLIEGIIRPPLFNLMIWIWLGSNRKWYPNLELNQGPLTRPTCHPLRRCFTSTLAAITSSPPDGVSGSNGSSNKSPMSIMQYSYFTLCLGALPIFSLSSCKVDALVLSADKKHHKEMERWSFWLVRRRLLFG